MSDDTPIERQWKLLRRLSGDLQRACRAAALVFDVEQVVAELLFGDEVGPLVVVDDELRDGAKVGFLSSLSEAGELEVLVHALTKLRGHEWILSRRRGE